MPELVQVIVLHLWEIESANLVGSYPTEGAAVRIVREGIDKHGRDVMDSIMLVREDAADT